MNMFVYLLLAWLEAITLAFNLDDRSPIIFEDPLDSKRESYFGYSLAVLLKNNTGTSWILVGAPRGNSSSPISKNVDEPGVSLLCGISPIKPCVEYEVASKTKYRQSWIGGAVASQHSTGRFAVCGHRFANYKSPLNQSYLTGACFVSDVATLENEKGFYNKFLSPFKLNDIAKQTSSLVDNDFAMYGISATFPKGDRHELVAGAPGKYNFCGTTVLSQDMIKGDVDGARSSSFLNSYIISRPLHSKNSFKGNTYLGYAVVEGRFLPNLDHSVYASAAPRDSNTRGQVFVFSNPEITDKFPHVHAILSGKEPGALFGTALASGDMNGDGFDELAVGAPLDSAENGAIFIYSTYKYTTLTLISEVRGKRGDQLGSSLAMADLDGDGRDELIAAAPIHSELRVYVIRGESSVSLQLKQTIKMSKLDFQPNIIFKGFPSSFAVGDVDGNGVPDISVGAHRSGHVVVLRGRPVVNLTVTIFEQPRTLLINTTAFNLTVCVKFYGPKSTQYFNTWRNISTDDSTRSTYDGWSRVRMTLTRDEEKCSVLTVKLSKTNKDFLTPILVKISFENDVTPESLRFSPTLVTKKGVVLGNDLFCPRCGILPKPLLTTVTIPFATECHGDDKICKSRLVIKAKILNSRHKGTLVVGERSVSLSVSVENAREPAYDCNLLVSTLQKRAHISRSPSDCVCPSTTYCPSTTCVLGNPLREKSKQFLIDIDVADLRIEDHNLTILLNATTQSQLTNDPSITLTLILLVDANLILTGKSEEESNTFHITEETNPSSEFILYRHLYEVQSIGVSPVDSAILTVRMPYGLNYGGKISVFSGLYRPETFAEPEPFYCDSSLFQYLEQESSNSNDDDQGYESTLNLPDSRSKRSVNEMTAFVGSHRAVNRAKRSAPLFDHYQIANTTNLPLNRTLWINCSSPDIFECDEIKCKIGPLVQHSVTRLLLTARLNTSVLKDVLGRNDIIAIVSSGSVEVIESWRSEQLAYGQQDVKKYDVSSVFTGAPQDARAPAWLYALSGCLGLLIFLLIILGLIKAGFFRRKMKEEIKAITAEEKRKSLMVVPKRKSGKENEPQENVSEN